MGTVVAIIADRGDRFAAFRWCAVSAADRALRWAAGGTVVALAGVAGAISYSHMAELARRHGEVGWRAHAFPVSVDGIEVVASLVLLAHRRAGTRPGWLPWAALAAGTAASVAANVAVGASDPIGRLVAGWPAVALLAAIKLLAGLLDAVPAAGAPGDPGPGPGGPGVGAPGPGPQAPAGPIPGPSRNRSVVVPAELVAAARVVRDRLVVGGRPVTRRSLAVGLRAAGHRIGNERLGPLLAAMDSDGGAPLAVESEAGGRHAGV
jgi:hypothetical protein